MWSIDITKLSNTRSCVRLQSADDTKQFYTLISALDSLCARSGHFKDRTSCSDNIVEEYMRYNGIKCVILPAGLSRECRVRRRCDVLLGHRRRWGTHAAACVGPAQAARARYLPGTMPGRALRRCLRIHCAMLHWLTTTSHQSTLESHRPPCTCWPYSTRISLTAR